MTKIAYILSNIVFRKLAQFEIFQGCQNPYFLEQLETLRPSVKRKLSSHSFQNVRIPLMYGLPVTAA